MDRRTIFYDAADRADCPVPKAPAVEFARDAPAASYALETFARLDLGSFT